MQHIAKIALIHTLSCLLDRGVLTLFSSIEHASSLARDLAKRYITIRCHHEVVKATGAESLMRSKLNRLVYSTICDIFCPCIIYLLLPKIILSLPTNSFNNVLISVANVLLKLFFASAIIST